MQKYQNKLEKLDTIYSNPEYYSEYCLRKISYNIIIMGVRP